MKLNLIPRIIHTATGLSEHPDRLHYQGSTPIHFDSGMIMPSSGKLLRIRKKFGPITQESFCLIMKTLIRFRLPIIRLPLKHI